MQRDKVPGSGVLLGAAGAGAELDVDRGPVAQHGDGHGREGDGPAVAAVVLLQGEDVLAERGDARVALLEGLEEEHVLVERAVGVAAGLELADEGHVGAVDLLDDLDLVSGEQENEEMAIWFICSWVPLRSMVQESIGMGKVN